MKKAKKNNYFLFLLIFPLSLLILFYLSNAYGLSAVNNTGISSAGQALSYYKKSLEEYETGDTGSALKTIMYDQNNFQGDKELTCEINFLTGKILFKQKDFLKAKFYFQKIILSAPNYKNIYDVVFYMSRCDFNMRNFNMSIRDFKFLASSTKKGSELHDKSLVYLTLTYAAMRRFETAKKYLNEDNVKNILDKIIFIKKQDNYFKSTVLNYMIQQLNNIPAALMILSVDNFFSPIRKDLCYKSYFTGLIDLKTKDYNDALDNFADSSKYCSGYYYHESVLHYGITLTEQNKPEGLKNIEYESLNLDYPGIKLSALEYLVTYYKNNGDNADTLKYIKRILFNYGLQTPTRKYYEELASQILYGEITKNYGKGDFKSPFIIFRKISFLLPKNLINPKIYKILAEIRLDENDYKKGLPLALKYYSTVKTTRSTLFLANYYFKAKKYKESIRLFDKINLRSIKDKELKSKAVGLAIDLFEKLKLKKEYISTVESYLNFLTPFNKIKGLFELGVYRFNLGYIKIAAAYFKKADNNIKLFTGKNDLSDITYGIYYYMGLINYQEGNYRTALDYYIKGYKENPQGSDFQYELSQIAYIYLKFENNKPMAVQYYTELENNAVSDNYKNLASNMLEAIKLQ